MCLGVVGQIAAIEGLVATVDFWGTRKKVRLDIVDEPVQVGDYILNHVGFAIRRIPHEEVEETLAFYEELLGASDLLARDLRAELATSDPGG